MAKVYSLAWTPDAGATTQTVQYRVKNSGTWLQSPNITPANPLAGNANSAQIGSLQTNTPYQFEVISNCCPGVQGISALKEGIIYAQQTVSRVIDAGVITVNQATMPLVDTVEYKLYNNAQVLQQTITATGANPQNSFNAVSAGTYSIQYRYITSINGVNVNSNDAAQNNAYYTTGNFTVS